MEIFLLIVVILLIILYFADVKGKLKDLGNQIDRINGQLKEMGSAPLEERSKKPAADPPNPAPEPVQPTPKEEHKAPTEPPEKIPEPAPEPVPDTLNQPPIASKTAADKAGTGQPKPAPPPPPKKTREPQPTFFQRNPDLEKFIGENLINKIGIVILVLGIGFFVKYAIDHDWINEIGRTFIGILCGGVLIGLAHRLRKSFKAFSSVLIGGGLAVFYFTIAIAFHEYQLLSQSLAFVIMIVITGFAVLLSIIYDRKELAILSILGGFGTPFMVSTGEGNYIVLFTYLTILNSGMLVLAYFKKWRILNLISYILTILIYTGWLTSKVLGQADAPYGGALIFATVFYTLFFAMNIINNLKEKTTFQAQEILILLSNTFLYFTAGLGILNDVQDGAYKGLFTASIGIFNFIFAYSLYKNRQVDRNLVFLLIGLVLTFLSLTAPIQLEGNYITLFWSLEAVLLLWLGQKSGIELIKFASVCVMLLMSISLVMDWVQIYLAGYQPLRVILNKGFITTAVSIVSVFITRHLLKKESESHLTVFWKDDVNRKIPLVHAETYQWIVTIGGALLVYIGFLMELSFQLNQYIGLSATRSVVLASYHYTFVLVLYAIARKYGPKLLSEGAAILRFVCILTYPIYYHGRILSSRDAYVANFDFGMFGYLYHYVDLLLAVILLITLISDSNRGVKMFQGLKNYMWWFASIVIVFFVTSELDHIVVLSKFDSSLPADYLLIQNHKIGWPIAWGVCSFAFMIAGMRKKIRTLRIISLSLFLLILLKLFIFDIRGMSEAGKIAAFVSLGVLLLVVSFLYQRLKQLIIDEDAPSNPINETESHE